MKGNDIEITENDKSLIFLSLDGSDHGQFRLLRFRREMDCCRWAKNKKCV